MEKHSCSLHHERKCKGTLATLLCSPAKRSPTHLHGLQRPVPTMAYSLGIDVGTSTVKVALIDVAGEEVCGEFYHPIGGNHADVDIPAARERNVADILLSLEDCMKDLESNEQLQQVRTVGVSGQMHGCVLWNDDFKLNFSSSMEADCNLSPSCSHLITWQDGRCDHSFLTSLPKGLAPVSTGYGCATLFWLQRHRAEMLKNFTRAGTIMDLVVWGLCKMTKKNGIFKEGCGDNTVVMSSQNATSWGYYGNGQWQKDL